MRKILIPIVAIAVVVAGGWVSTWSKPAVNVAADVAALPGDPVHGEYLARVGDCMACHTAKGGEPFAGGYPLKTPLGTIYSSNITSDRVNGIGGYSFNDFVLAMREGVAKDGRRMYPAMPYTSYAKVSDADLKDLYAYFTTKAPPSSQPNRQSDIVWPLSIRWPLAFWDRAFLDDTQFHPVDTQSVEWNRGAYLVQGLAHCSTCHTPRGAAMQELDVSGKTSFYLSGAALDNASPIDLRGSHGSGLGDWSEQDIVSVLKTGRSPHSAVTGPMGDVIEHSTQYMTDADLHAIATYVKSLSPSDRDAASYHASDATLKSIMKGTATGAGASIYIDSCAACHRQNGEGATRVFPSLAGNPMVLADKPDSLIAVILNGSRLPSTAGGPTPLAMPPFAWRYDDEQVAELATFVRSSWGNSAPAVTASQVKDLRAALSH
jgi:mono/diheme cytochrome c family protein